MPKRHQDLDPRKEMVKVLTDVSHISGHRQSEVFRSFCRLAACAVAAGTRETEYLEEVRRWKPEHMRLFSLALANLIDAMEREPFTDILGPIHMECGSRADQQWRGEFYTPMCISKMMAQMTFDPAAMPEDRPLEVNEPCCGSAAMVLAFAGVMHEHHGISPLCMRATCEDAARIACDMAFINLTMNGIPCEVAHRNTLTRETWGVWRNLFWWTARPHRKAPTGPELVQEASGQFAMPLEVAA